MAGQYNNIGIEHVDDGEFDIFLNGKRIQTVENDSMKNISKVLIASDAAAGTAGSLHIDNVVIGDPDDAPPKAVDPAGKLSVQWGKLKGN
jgi:hypothetical protein